MICLVCGEDDLQYFFELINYDGSIRYECGICNGSYKKPEPTTTIQPEPTTTTTIQPEPKPEKIKRKKITTKQKVCNHKKSNNIKQIMIPKKISNSDRYRLSKLLKYQI